MVLCCKLCNVSITHVMVLLHFCSARLFLFASVLVYSVCFFLLFLNVSILFASYPFQQFALVSVPDVYSCFFYLLIFQFLCCFFGCLFSLPFQLFPLKSFSIIASCFFRQFLSGAFPIDFFWYCFYDSVLFVFIVSFCFFSIVYLCCCPCVSLALHIIGMRLHFLSTSSWHYKPVASFSLILSWHKKLGALFSAGFFVAY